jgi:hypothetical protein
MSHGKVALNTQFVDLDDNLRLQPVAFAVICPYQRPPTPWQKSIFGGFFYHDKPLLEHFVEKKKRLRLSDTIAHLKRMIINARDYVVIANNAKIIDMEVWKVQILEARSPQRANGRTTQQLEVHQRRQ